MVVKTLIKPLVTTPNVAKVDAKMVTSDSKDIVETVTYTQNPVTPVKPEVPAPTPTPETSQPTTPEPVHSE